MYITQGTHTTCKRVHNPIINQLIRPLFSPVVEHFAVLTAHTVRMIVALKSVQQEIAGGTAAECSAVLAVEELPPRYYVEIGRYWWKAEPEMMRRTSYYGG